MDAHCLEVGGHAPANTPHLLHLGIAEHPVALERIGNVHNPARLGLYALGRMVGQLGERLRTGDANANRDARALKDS